MKESTKWILLGILIIVCGVIVLGSPYVASFSIAIVTGVFLLVGGVFQVVGGFSVEGMGAKLLTWLMGALMLYLGYSFLSTPVEGVVSLSMLVLFLLIAGGIARIIFAFSMTGTMVFWPVLISGILALVLAVIIFSAAKDDPTVLLRLLGIIMGIEMLFNGFSMLFMGMFSKESEA